MITKQGLAYDDDEKEWAKWLPGRRTGVLAEWPAEGDRRTAADGDDIETLFRSDDVDPLEQRTTYHIKARLWHAGDIVREEEYDLRINLYFVPEMRLMLECAGFREVSVEGDYTGVSATADDGWVNLVARK